MCRLSVVFPAALAFLLVVQPRPGTAQVGPLEVAVVGDSVSDEGDRVSWSLHPWRDRAGLASRYRWDFGDGSSPVSRESETAVGHRYMQDGEYTVSASDGAGTTLQRVRVRPVAPTVELLSYIELPGPERRIRFQAVATDPGLDTLTYVWNFGDGSPPREEIELVEVEHTYPDEEPYTVTLTVMDEDTLTDRRTLRLRDPGLQGRVEGDLSLEVDAEPGNVDWPGQMTSVIPSGPTTAESCTYASEFVDDDSRTNVGMIWVSPTGGGLEPGTYTVVDAMATGPPGPGQVVVQLAHALNEQTWTMARDRGAAPPGGGEGDGAGAEADEQEEESGGLGGLLGKVKEGVATAVGKISSSRNPNVFAPAQTPVMPDMSNVSMAVFVGLGGTLTIDRVEDRWVAGQVDLRMKGHHMVAGGFEPFRERIGVQGNFAWPLDQTADATDADCGEAEFRVDEHLPRAEAMAVDYETPEVSVTFNRGIDRSTVTESTIELGYLDESDEFQRVSTRIVHVDGRTVRLVVDDFLDDAVYHEVRVKGGDDGVLSRGGDPLPDDYEWRFATMPELVKRPEPSSR